MKRYVVGFIFSPRAGRVLLIEKRRPDWQKGRLNGVGGHIEEGETPIDAMVRETVEETGLLIEAKYWRLVCTMRHEGEYEIHFFKAFVHPDILTDARTMTDEPIGLYPASRLPRRAITNVRWIVPLCLDRHAQPFIVEDAGGN